MEYIPKIQNFHSVYLDTKSPESKALSNENYFLFTATADAFANLEKLIYRTHELSESKRVSIMHNTYADLYRHTKGIDELPNLPGSDGLDLTLARKVFRTLLFSEPRDPILDYEREMVQEIESGSTCDTHSYSSRTQTLPL